LEKIIRKCNNIKIKEGKVNKIKICKETKKKFKMQEIENSYKNELIGKIL